MNASVAAVPDVENLNACGVLTIDLGALQENYRTLKALAAPAAVSAVVKADAYGLGAIRVAQALYDEDCRTFFVAHFVEALRLRPLLPRNAAIFILNGLQRGNEEAAADLGFVPVLNSLEQMARWCAVAQAKSVRLKAALQIDTGMSRLGLCPEDVEAVVTDAALLSHLQITYIISHLAAGDDPADVLNTDQLAAMRAACARFPKAEVSFANSGGILLGADFHHQLARPGIALYGGNPSNAPDNPMKPVVRLTVKVIQTRTVPAGTKVGYGGTHITAGETRLATIAAGYADGLPRHLSNTGAAYYEGVRLPVAGRVSMDSMTLDIGALPEGTLSLGSEVELIGKHQPLEQIARDAGTISYEILTRLGHRYQRQYLQPDGTVLYES